MKPISHANNFNLLRLVLAVLVMASHCPELIDGDRSREVMSRLFGTYSLADSAVNAFFILSGYFVTASWVSSPRIVPFLTKRSLRIVPGFTIVVAISLLVVGPLAAPTFWSDFPYRRFFSHLLLLKFEAPPAFPGSHLPILNAPLWTIHYEAACYAFLACLGVAALVQRWVISFLFAAALGLLLGYNHGFSEMPAFAPSHSPLDHIVALAGSYLRPGAFFLAGATWFVWREKFKMKYGILAVTMILTTAMLFSPATAPVAMTVPFVYLLFFIGNVPFPPSRWFNRVDLSYGFYLYSWPIQKLLLWYGLVHTAATLAGSTLVLGLGAAAASWFAVERPFLRLKPKNKLSVAM